MAGTAGQTASREEVPWAVRRLFEALARRRPLSVVVDDLHWAEPALLDLLEHVARFARDAPILIVGIARPELLDDRPDRGVGSPEVAAMMLEPLGEDECGRLIRNLLGGAGVSTQTAASIAKAAGGNPLFIEELIAELIDRRLLVRSDDRWEATADLAHIPIPAGVSALLAARLDRSTSRSGRSWSGRASSARCSTGRRSSRCRQSPRGQRWGHASPCWSADN